MTVNLLLPICASRLSCKTNAFISFHSFHAFSFLTKKKNSKTLLALGYWGKKVLPPALTHISSFFLHLTSKENTGTLLALGFRLG